jgi:uncharacterized iron-regulated membrane protein
MIRSVLFWTHLVAGVVSGLVVGLLSLTGVALAFQPQILDGLRSDLGRLERPAGAERLPLEALVEAGREAMGQAPSAISVAAEPQAAVLLRFGRADRLYLHPWTGEVLDDPAKGWAEAFAWTTGLHRWLAMDGDGRATGKAITGASNAAFLLLMVTGLFLWFPRRWTRLALRQILWFRSGLRPKARDWHWHHVIGFWTLPVLLVLALSGMMISYPWATRLVFTVAGDEPPKSLARPGPPSIWVQAPEGQAPLPLDALIAKARATAPGSSEVTLLLDGTPGEAGAIQAAHLPLQARNTPPPRATSRLSLDPFSGEVLQRSGFADQSAGARLRGWLRFLHTGEALGLPGQLAAAVASMGAVVLVWTGLALAWRRLLRAKHPAKKAGRSHHEAAEVRAKAA